MAIPGKPGWGMVLKIIRLACLMPLLVACGSDNASQDQQAESVSNEPMTVEEARTVYTLNCASCHGPDGKLKGSNAADLSVSTMNPKQVEHTIRNGNDKGMMPYKEILTKREIDGLVEFVQTLREE